jgi:hypothetical protein
MPVTAAELMAASGRFPLAPGLTDTEIAAVEQEFGFTFAPDHRAFLAAALPTGRHWPDWRAANRDNLRDRLTAPVDGLLFDVAENDFWYDGWGPRPPSSAAAATAARGYLLTAPRLVPLFSHRYLPAGLDGHPVLSVYQSDVVYYGADLADWLNREFALGEPSPTVARATVPFWRDLL